MPSDFLHSDEDDLSMGRGGVPLDPKDIRRARRIWMINVVGSIVLALGCAAASAALFLLSAGVITQKAPLDKEATAGQGFLIALFALAFLILFIVLLRGHRKLPQAQRDALGHAWLRGGGGFGGVPSPGQAEAIGETIQIMKDGKKGLYDGSGGEADPPPAQK